VPIQNLLKRFSNERLLQATKVAERINGLFHFDRQMKSKAFKIRLAWKVQDDFTKHPPGDCSSKINPYLVTGSLNIIRIVSSEAWLARYR
jgi:hypothetical protein